MSANNKQFNTVAEYQKQGAYWTFIENRSSPSYREL